MNLVFTMAGLYERFEPFSLNVPKYLLPYKSQSVFIEVVKSYLKPEVKKIYFIVNNKDSSFFNLLKSQIKSMKIKEFEFIPIEKTHSQIESAFKGLQKINKKINKNVPIGITNIDTMIINRDFNLYKKKLLKYDCLVDIFFSNNKNYSYVQFDKKNNVINIKEKIIISNFASSGLYFFKSSDLLLKELVKGTGLGETYFSHLINRMIKNKFSVTCNKISPKNKTIILGTPEQYISEIQKN